MAMTFFMVTSGFGTQLSHGRDDLTALRGAGLARLGRFYLARLDRIVLTLWIAMYGEWLWKMSWGGWGEPKAPSEDAAPSALYSQFSVDQLLVCSLTGFAPAAFDYEYCEGEQWFVGFLVLLTLLYPLLGRSLYFLEKWAGPWLLLLLPLAVWATFHGLYLGAYLQGDESAPPAWSNGALRKFVGFAIDFLVGAATASLVRRHEPAAMKGVWVSRLRGLLADACVVLVVVYALVLRTRLGVCPGLFSVVHDRATCLRRPVSELIDAHGFTFVFALFIWGASARGGSGAFAALLAHPAPVSLGRYSLEVYLFSIPISVILVNLGLPGEDAVDGRYGLLKFVEVESFVTYQLVLWTFSAVVAEGIVAPATVWLRGAYERRVASSSSTTAT
jgi:hypothetical protein